MKRSLFLILTLFLSISLLAQKTQTASFKSTSQLFVKEGKQYVSQFKLSQTPSDEILIGVREYAKANSVRIEEKQLKKGAYQLRVIVAEHLATSSFLAKLLYQLQVVEVYFGDKGQTAVSIDEFSTKY